MPYLVRKGTKIAVQMPSGEVTQHRCRDDTARLGRHIRKVDDASPARGTHLRKNDLGHQKHRLEVDGENLVPVLFRDLVDGLGAGDARVVDQDRHRSKLWLSRGDQSSNIGSDRDIRRRWDATAIRALDFPTGLVCLVLPLVAGSSLAVARFGQFVFDGFKPCTGLEVALLANRESFQFRGYVINMKERR